jgi:hypothetical protein
MRVVTRQKVILAVIVVLVLIALFELGLLHVEPAVLFEARNV